jgi:rod shape-determining protein MreD
MPVNLSRSQVIAISFLLGIIIDTFFDTVGMHAAACSLAGMFRDPLMYFFTNKEIVENATPSYKTLGIGAFMKYVICLVALHHTALFSIESISLFNPVLLIMRIFACVFFTVLIVFIVEAFNIERNKSEA